MWKKTTVATLVAAIMTSSAMQPLAAQGYYDRNNGPYNDQYYRDQYAPPPPPPPPGPYYSADQDPYYRDCVQQRQGNTAGGLIIRAIAGGLIGNSVSRGPQRGAGTALGAVLGGAAGAAIGNSLNCEDRGYVYRTYYDGFERGRAHARYQWRSPRTDAYGYLEVGNYYSDPRGERCATYTQRVWIHGRPEVAAGHACRQP